MPMPTPPVVIPVIPEGYLFIAITTADPNAPMVIMHWPTIRRDGLESGFYKVPATKEAIEERCQKEGLSLVSWRFIQYNDIPPDRTYRDAWADIGGRVAHNMNKAREIHRGHIRVARGEKFAALDAAYMRADERNDNAEKKRVGDIKQRLRDMPSDPAIDAAQTIEELRAFWPDDLL